LTRVEPDGGGGGAVGINPQLLQSMINTMNSSAGDALNLVNGYISQLSRVGLDTSSLSKAVQDLNWAQDQVPMLNRRQSLAQAMAEQNPGLVDVSAGAGALDFPTTQAAQAAGKANGAKALQAIEDHGNDDFILTELEQYADDPAYMAAFFTALGPQGLTALGLQVTGYQQSGDRGQYRTWSAAVGQGLATASYQMPYKSGWLGQLQLPNDLVADPALPQLSLIQPFLEHGVYSSAWLGPLGQYAMQQAFIQQQPGLAESPPVALDGIWTALSNNPAFDAQFYRQNFSNENNPADSISGVMSSMYEISVADSAFARMVQSATVAPADAAGSGPYAANAQLTVRYFGADSSLRTSGAVRAVFGTIAENYFDDLTYTVRAAAPGIGAKNIPGLQVTASEPEWGNFIEEAMRDKTTAAQLLTFYTTWVNRQPPDDRGSGLEHVPENQGFWNDSSLGLLNDFMARSYKGAGAPAGQGPVSIAEIAAEGGSAFFTSLVFGPEAGIADALLEGGKDTFQAAAKQTLQSVWPDTVDSSPNGAEALGQLTNVQQQWAGTVNRWYNGSPGQNQPPPPIDPVQYLGQTYTGDPTAYEKRYGGSFIKDGRIEDPGTIAENPQALAAYNAWLQDPAIVNANESRFRTWGFGELMSQYANSYSGGGRG
jgi:hypothetical protein